MKELDKTKKYDLSKLNDEQLIELCNKKNELNLSDYFNDSSDLINDVRCTKWRFLKFNNSRKLWYIDKNKLRKIICATELFEDDKGNVVTQYDRTMINEINKPMTEEEKELWLFVYKELVKYHTFIPHKQKADQAVKDFREALKM